MRRTTWKFHGLLLLIFLVPRNCPAETLELYYFEYPPYYYTTPTNQASGIIVEQAKKIFARAGVEAHFTFMPSKRILYEIQNSKPMASLGWFKNPDREEFARFSVPLYVNKPCEILHLRSKANEFKPYKTLEALMQSNRFYLGRVEGLSEGPYIDGLLAKYPQKVDAIATDSVHLVTMLKLERFDYMLMPPEEMNVLIHTAGLHREDFILRPMQDIPTGNIRYIMYSKAVDEKLIHRIDQAILEEKNASNPLQ